MKRLLVRLIYGGSSKLRPYEQACLDYWKDSLPAEAICILNRQLKRFDLIKRYSKGKLVVFYWSDDWSFSSWPAEDLFPQHGEEVRVARIKLSVFSGGKKRNLKVEIVFHRGRLSSLEFNAPPKIGKGKFEVIGLDKLADPLAVEVSSGHTLETPVKLTGWLGELVKIEVLNIKSPLLSAEQEMLLKQIDATLPVDYIEMLKQVDGFECVPCTVFGLSAIRKVVRPDGNYYILAEIAEKGDIAVLQESKTAMLFYLAYESDEAETMGTSFTSTLRNKLGWRIDNTSSQKSQPD